MLDSEFEQCYLIRMFLIKLFGSWLVKYLGFIYNFVYPINILIIIFVKKYKMMLY
jgi:hypothetical protein